MTTTVEVCMYVDADRVASVPMPSFAVYPTESAFQHFHSARSLRQLLSWCSSSSPSLLKVGIQTNVLSSPLPKRIQKTLDALMPPIIQVPRSLLPYQRLQILLIKMLTLVLVKLLKNGSKLVHIVLFNFLHCNKHECHEFSPSHSTNT